MSLLRRCGALLCALLALSAVLPSSGAHHAGPETKRYVGPSGTDPCMAPEADPGLGGACFDVHAAGARLRISVADDAADNPLASYHVMDAFGNTIAISHFCGSVTTQTLHPSAARVSVRVSTTPTGTCPGSEGGGVSGSITVSSV